MNTQHPNTAAGEHFADAERILAALPLVKRGATVTATSKSRSSTRRQGVAATLLSDWQTTASS